jgi:hypothetical protein
MGSPHRTAGRARLKGIDVDLIVVAIVPADAKVHLNVKSPLPLHCADPLLGPIRRVWKRSAEL